MNARISNEYDKKDLLPLLQTALESGIIQQTVCLIQLWLQRDNITGSISRTLPT